MGLLAEAIEDGDTKTVAINKSDWTVFYSGEYVKTIGVWGLSACSVFAIVSPHAAAIAHIGPNVLGSSSLTSFIELAKTLTDEVVQTCLDHPQLFPPESKTYIVCATLNNSVITAPEQLGIMYRGVQSLPHASVLWHYEQSTEATINNNTHLGTFFVDGRSGSPRVFVEDRDITEAPTTAPVWKIATVGGQMRYQLLISNVVIETLASPPVNQWISNGQKWVMWNGQSWTSQ
ncbi:hypothetical protein OPT61_g7045 [Boeremia exigua]|uniref:Uncharacterized protein n=1 Tax=Boeremia exigua TaxID=749465 RepID=A0ACC2I3W8_9PLEO|nr:hypothetical protein OPT61_g7045 [Boeremia exigua]